MFNMTPRLICTYLLSKVLSSLNSLMNASLVILGLGMMQRVGQSISCRYSQPVAPGDESESVCSRANVARVLDCRGNLPPGHHVRPGPAMIFGPHLPTPSSDFKHGRVHAQIYALSKFIL